MLLTRYLEYSLPYRLVLTRAVLPRRSTLLLDAFAELLVRLHLAGFFWGDCSLSNTLFRRDAGRLSAYLVDAETGELHEQLSRRPARRTTSSSRGRTCTASSSTSVTTTRRALVEQVLGAYERLWSELTHEEVFADDERFRLQERLRRLQRARLRRRGGRAAADRGRLPAAAAVAGRRAGPSPAAAAPAHGAARAGEPGAAAARRHRRVSAPSSRRKASRRSPQPRSRAAG